jgi:glycosyltransferase involved in cell wall biosynthesis
MMIEPWFTTPFESKFSTHPSIRILTSKLRRAIRPASDVIHFFSHAHRPKEKTRDVQDLVCLGDAPLALLEPEWINTRGTYRVWTYSSALYRVMTEYIGLDAAKVGYIDRYKFFDLSKKRYSLGSSQSFVIAQRDFPGKNLAAALELAFELRRTKFPRHPIYVCGPRAEPSALQGYDGITFLGDLGSHWFNDPHLRRAALVNLSTSHHEDFGISIAQAQARGMPIIVSDWFAHKDVRGDNVHFVQPRDIVRVNLKPSKKDGRLLVKSMRESSGTTPRNLNRTPQLIRGKELLALAKELTARQRLSISLFLEPLSRTTCRLTAAPDLSHLLGYETK